ncbi:hypothetical protein ABPG74_005306 [Tetrahymena malaccensis]
MKISSKNILKILIILASLSLIVRFFFRNSVQQGKYPTILEYLKCLQNICNFQQCELGDNNCEKAFLNYLNCQKQSSECQEWEQEIQKNIQEIKMQESFFRCKDYCAPRKEDSEVFYQIFQCDKLCAMHGMKDQSGF